MSFKLNFYPARMTVQGTRSLKILNQSLKAEERNLQSSAAEEFFSIEENSHRLLRIFSIEKGICPEDFFL